MKFRTWLDGWKSLSQNRRHNTRRIKARRQTARGKLTLDSLEDRTVPAFATPIDYGVGSSPQDVATGYFNSDAVLDLAVANYYDSTVSVLLGNSNGTFQDPAQAFATGAYPLSVAVGDFNGDSVDDIATANNGDVSVLIGNGDGTFGTPTHYSMPSSPTSVAVGDFTGDGSLDLGVMSSYGGYMGYANVLVGDGLGNFSAPNTTYIGYGNFTSATAFNSDGVGPDDLATANTYYGQYYGAVAVLLGDALGFLQPSSILNTGGDAQSVAVGDVNADGAIDLVTTDSYTYYYTDSLNRVSVLLGDGSGGFGGAQSYPAGIFPKSVVLGDFNHDTKVDIATANIGSNDISVLYGRGNGTFSAAVNSATSTAYALAVGDFNGDSWLDAATANPYVDNASVLLNDQSWPPPPPPTLSINDRGITEGNSGTTDATFTIYLSSASEQDITIHYATADGSAAAGSDYTGVSGDVTIPAGDTTYDVKIEVKGDRVRETDESFVVNLSAPVNATIDDGQGIGYIYDDEPVIYINNATVTEGNTGSVNATFTVSLSGYYDDDVTVQYATATGTAGSGDFTSTSGNITIPAYQLSNTFTVAILGDRLGESTENFVINLSSPVNAGIGNAQGIGTILDNEPRISINNVSKKEGNGGTNKFVFTVTLSAAYDQTVTVNFATGTTGTATSGTDYQAKSSTVTFAPGVTSMTITINVITEKVKESDETFHVNLSGASSNALISIAQGIGTILDDDNR